MSPNNSNETLPSNPETPRKTPTGKNGAAAAVGAATLANNKTVGATPKSAPAATSSGSGSGVASNKKKPEPTLLADFLLGRPSPARLAAQRSASKPRRKSVALDAAGVREELRQEMRAAAVRRLQQPNGVTNRVKAWQKASVKAMKEEGGGPPHAEDLATEPTEVAVNLDSKSVTEEDRVRIKMRQKPKKRKVKVENSGGRGTASEGEAQPKTDDDKPDIVVKEARPKTAPKKRIVSDEHWMKQRKGHSPPRVPRQQKPKAEGSPTPIPKDFLQRTAQNPSVKNKIHDWAKRVELPDPPPPRVKRYHHETSGATVTVEEDASSVGPPKSDKTSTTQRQVDDGIRVKPLKPPKIQVSSDDGIRVYPVRKKEPFDDGIRVRPMAASSLPDDGIRIRPGQPTSDDGSTVGPSSKKQSKERTSRSSSSRREQPAEDIIEVIEETETQLSTPTRNSSGRRRSRRSPSPQTTATQTEVTQTESEVQPRSRGSSRRNLRRSPKRSVDSPTEITQTESDIQPKRKDSPRRRRSRRSPSPPTTVTQTEITQPESEIPSSRESSRRRQRHGPSPTTVTQTEITQTESDITAKKQPSRRLRRRSPSTARQSGVSQSESDIPARKSTRRLRRRRSPTPTTVTQTDITDSEFTQTDITNNKPRQRSVERDVRPRDSDSDESGSDRVPPTVLGNKSLADIPFGYSAFSELDLPLGDNARHTGKKPPKAQRNGSFKAVPNVFKKVVSGAKEIIHEKVDPPKPVANNPPSIENWLSNTVDPFIEAGKSPAVEHEKPQTSRKPSVSATRHKEKIQPPPLEIPDDQENTDPRLEDGDTTPKRERTPALSSSSGSGLKRRRATRSASSPMKASGKKPFREVLKEAFRGESIGHKLPPTVYPSCEADPDDEVDFEEDDWEHRDSRRHSSGGGRRSLSPDTLYTAESSLTSASGSTGPVRPKPPTRGSHELSTIISEESRSSMDSDAASDVSHTTITQATAFTKSTDIPRQRSHRSQQSGLKRRLTKHSDLVSVLSLPDHDGQLIPPSRSRSIKSSRSLHRKPSRLNNSRVNELLDEFADDEHFYQRELKTLVDGVIPVLLTHVINGDNEERRAKSLAKSVTNMGVALEKMRNYHKRVPLTDIRHLLEWLDAVSPVYDNYLDVWRLGFQDLIVNLAPASGAFDDQDSLLNALPRNEDGDILGENGERVDVAYLLKRPLIRVKWMTKFLKAAVTVVATQEAEDLLSLYEALQEKARKRHREETARITDEDANNTDTTRARDLRTLAPLDHVFINRSRQVAAKDSFALDLDHSNGQRLECEIEIIHRDNLSVPADKGDILLREISVKSRSWLLFPPIPKENISCRRVEGERALVVMIRGMHNREEWFELLRLSTTDEGQVKDWLEILGTNPLPPLSKPKIANFADDLAYLNPDEVDVPVGERRSEVSATASTPEKPKTPARYHKRQASAPSTSSSPGYTSPVSLPSPLHPGFSPEDSVGGRSRFSEEDAYEEASKPARAPPNSTPFREDGAPPPPIHRTLSTQGPSHLAPPVELAPPARVKRRGSSPLKHEYHPSDVSSDSASDFSSDSESSQFSSDDLDEDDVPDTIPGYSIKKSEEQRPESVVSDNSITPDHSASQVGVAAPKENKQPEREPPKFVASVSYWHEKRKNMWEWEDISTEASTIVVYPGYLEVHRRTEQQQPIRQAYPLQSSGTSEVDNRDKDAGDILPLLKLILTPVVMIRKSNLVDIEIASPPSPESRLTINGDKFRFRTSSPAACNAFYEAVHFSRQNNARYIQLAEEARVRSFGQQQNGGYIEGSNGDGENSARRGSWFGRKNSYRASTRAPSISQGSGASTTISAASFLRRLTGGGNKSFNLGKSTVDKQSRPSSVDLGGRGPGSLYTSSASSNGWGGNGASTPPQSLSVSLTGSGSRWSNGLAKPFSPDRPLEIRCHLNVRDNRWKDKGDCILNISQPPPGVRQELALYHGMEKRVIVVRKPKSEKDKPIILLDAVLGSKCFMMIGKRGIQCSVWEDLRDEEGRVGVAPRTGAISGKVTKWCFQCKSELQAEWIMKILTSEVPGLMVN